MIKKVIISAILGGIFLIFWTIVTNSIFGFHSRINMRQLDDERLVYKLLKEQISVPGKYICNPAITPEGIYPEGEPVFSIVYGGVGHEAAGSQMLFGLVIFFLVPAIGAWMLSLTSFEVRSSYTRKVLFFTAIGIIVALFSDLSEFGIGSYPFKDALLIALNHLITWTLLGLVIAWQIKPEKRDEVS